MNNIVYKMGKISYINASPVYFGLDNGLLPQWLEMRAGSPAILNQMIKNNEIVLSPISAAFYGMNHRDLLILPDLSISCKGKVMSVMLMSKYSIAELDNKNIVLTKESATAASFLRMIFSMKKFYPRFETSQINVIDDVNEEADAVLVIGDVALTQPWGARFEYSIDLGALWYSMTQLPFVFAVWVVSRSFAEENPAAVNKILKLLYKSRDEGYANIVKIIQAGAVKLNLDESYVKEYYNHLYCDLDTEKIKALEMFFKFLYEEKILKEKVKIELFSL